ncbi:MAG: hypothetical protein MH252_11015 [Thermosynechococcaceae cyanobacterium MS004]|nr:hypothetical protein [Thermosynechococcaceae cyanobacterium MS004]
MKLNTQLMLMATLYVSQDLPTRFFIQNSARDNWLSDNAASDRDRPMIGFQVRTTFREQTS